MSSLAPCPFCNCAMEVVTYGAVMKFVGDHDGACPIGWSGEQFSASLSESNLVWASGCWNRRAPLPAEQPSNPVPRMGGNTDQADAERYRYLRDEIIGDDPEMVGLCLAKTQGLDAAVDLARIVGQQTKGGSDA